jgi:hypothetical protein
MTTTSPHAFPLDVRPAVEIYQARGLATIPLPPRSKDPGYPGWQNLRVQPETLDQHFPAGEDRNVAVLNGGPSNNTADSDLDAPEALRAAPYFLPPTGWVFGRKSAPRSHWIYRTGHQALESSQEEYPDLDGKMLVELPGTGGLTVFPPSTHKETGELITWNTFTEPAEVGLETLRMAVRAVAAAALLARHWPETGSRDKAAMSLSGGLAREGWEKERVSRFCEAVAVAAGDEEARMRAGKAEPTARKLEAGKKTTGWPKLAELLKGDGEAVVCRAREWLGLAVHAAPDIPLPEETPWPDPLVEKAYHGLAGELVRVLEPASEADPAALLVQALVAFGSMVGRTAYFVAESDRHYPNEFAALVGETAKARKGSSWGRIECALAAIDEGWEQRVQTGLSSGEGVVWWCRDPLTKRERVKGSNPIQYEEVEADPGAPDKRLLVLEPEFANVLQVIERQANTLSAILRLAWDGRTLQTLAKNAGAKATGTHVSVIAHITAEEVRRLLTSTQAANGFGNRFMWFCSRRSKRLPEGGQVDGQAVADLRRRFADALAFAWAQGEMRRDEDARCLWREVYGPLSDGQPGMAGVLLARAEAHVLRVSLIYALLDCSPLIQAPHLLAALALWDYAEQSVHHIFGDSLGDPVADDLLRLLRGCPQGLTRNDLMNYLGRNLPSDRIGRALGLLLRHHLVRREQEKTGGRPAEPGSPVPRRRGERSYLVLLVYLVTRGTENVLLGDCPESLCQAQGPAQRAR